MNNYPSNDNGRETLSFSTFVSHTNVVSGTGGDNNDDSALKKAIEQLFSAHQKTAPSPLFKWNAVSRHEVNAYGRPRILSKWEVILHALALPVVIGVVIGYGLAISVLALHNPSTFQPRDKAGQSQVASLEVVP